MPELIDDVRAALEAVRTHRGKKVFRMRGRTVSTPAHVEQAALLEGLSPEDFALVVASLNEPTLSEPKPAHSDEEWEALLEDLSEKSLQIVDLKETIETLQEKIAKSYALPANALELIKTAGGLSTPKAEAVLAALQNPQPGEG